MSFDLTGRRALVTGGGRGIGRAISLALGHAGADVVVNYLRHADSAAEVVALLQAMGRRATAVAGDVSLPDDAARLVATTVGFLGGVDIAVCNAGILRRTAVLDIEIEEWRQILDTNLTGTFLVAQAAARQMAAAGRGGAIINVSSVGGLNPTRNLAHYCCSKAGITMLTKNMALELAPHGIRVNEINPGLIETDLNRSDIARPEFLEPRMSRIPMQRVGMPEDVAGAVVFLASDAAGLVTGHSLLIDGGAAIS